MLRTAKLSPIRALAAAFVLVAPASFAPAQKPATDQVSAPARRTAAAFDRARTSGPLALQAFVARMPKGADLHMHLSGAIYAETFLKDAAEDHLCVDVAKLSLEPATKPDGCAKGLVPAAKVFADQHLYDALVDGFSMRAFVPSAGTNGHDQFFATFSRFDNISDSHFGEWLDEVATRAAAQNEQYLEIMKTPPFSHAATLAYQIGWPAPLVPATDADSSTPDQAGGAAPAELAAFREKLLAAGLRDELKADDAQLNDGLAKRRQIEHCGTPQALPACSVEVRFLVQILRGFPPQQVFAQTLLGFEEASENPSVVGLNFVMPEDGYLSMSEYHRQMLMLDYLHSVYPNVHISLHAGELAPGLVAPAGLRFHIREAVELGHAERIGHGVDVMYETNPDALLKELAARHVMIEINLTSNDVILGITPQTSPFPNYRAAHVPVALSTDDEGVSRIDLTHEYTRAALEFHLGYADLKQSARTSLEHSFLPGSSLWAHPDDFVHLVNECRGEGFGAAPVPACGEYLSHNLRAAQEWELERRFQAFENASNP
jgi:adenosine deaminase